jgi:hypothetical protein
MASRNQQSHAKRARELAVKEKRERKRAKKAETALRRAEGWVFDENGELVPGEGYVGDSELASGEDAESDGTLVAGEGVEGEGEATEDAPESDSDMSAAPAAAD